MALLVTIIVGDFGYVLGFSLFLTTSVRDYGWSGISFSCNEAIILQLASSILLSLISLFFLFFLDFSFSLLGLEPLFGLVDLILALFLKNPT